MHGYYSAPTLRTGDHILFPYSLRFDFKKVVAKTPHRPCLLPVWTFLFSQHFPTLVNVYVIVYSYSLLPPCSVRVDFPVNPSSSYFNDDTPKSF